MITRQTETVRLTTDASIRCGRCNKLLAEKASRPWRIQCVRCGHTNISRPIILWQDAPSPQPRPVASALATPTKRAPKKRKAPKKRS